MQAIRYKTAKFSTVAQTTSNLDIEADVFRRTLLSKPGADHILIDPALPLEDEYTSSFGLEWTTIDGYESKETLSHGHLFGRFLLPKNFLHGKRIADVGCGNGRIGRIIAPTSDRYIGLDMSNALSAFPTYIENFEKVTLIRASATDLPLDNASVDVTLCWGVLHHVDEPEKALSELLRITKPGGHVLIFVYPPAFDVRRNFNFFSRELPPEKTLKLTETTSDEIDDWCELDDFYGNVLAKHLQISRKQSRSWQLFQYFDGISPRYHWSLTSMMRSIAPTQNVSETMPGTFIVKI